MKNRSIKKSFIGRAITILIAVFLIASCVSTPLNESQGSGDFSFENYDFLIVQKSTPLLFDIDVEFGDLMQVYSMKIITFQKYEGMTLENQNRTLYAKIFLDFEHEINLLNILFEDAVTGKTKNNFRGVAEGDMFNRSDRSKALQTISNKIIKALKKDKGLIANKNKLLADEREMILPGMRPSATDVEVKEYLVIARTLNVRKAPMVGFDIIEKVKEGDVLKKISSLLDWIKVELPSGKRGWVSMKYLQPIAKTQ